MAREPLRTAIFRLEQLTPLLEQRLTPERAPDLSHFRMV